MQEWKPPRLKLPLKTPVGKSHIMTLKQMYILLQQFSDAKKIEQLVKVQNKESNAMMNDCLKKVEGANF